MVTFSEGLCRTAAVFQRFWSEGQGWSFPGGGVCWCASEAEEWEDYTRCSHPSSHQRPSDQRDGGSALSIQYKHVYVDPCVQGQRLMETRHFSPDLIRLEQKEIIFRSRVHGLCRSSFQTTSTYKLIKNTELFRNVHKKLEEFTDSSSKSKIKRLKTWIAESRGRSTALLRCSFYGLFDCAPM